MGRTTGIAGMLLVSAGLGGCGYGLGLGGGEPVAKRQAPEPIAAAPTTPVAQAPLQPVLPPIPGQAPAEPVPPADPAAVASTPASTKQTAALGRTDVLGGWTVISGPERCSLAASLTTWTGGYRASTRGCTSPELQKVSAWTLNGNQLVLKGSDGATVATLSPTSAGQLDGRTDGGKPVSLNR